MQPQRQYDLVIDEAESSARRALDAAQEAAARAGSYVQDGVARLSERAQELAHGAGDGLARGRDAVTAWAAGTRDTVKSHPLQALAATVGVGYVAGKLLFRRRA
jgi:ElaB/YqjD/DUF883 family membrane-anchored ribosome-binding protein